MKLKQNIKKEDLLEDFNTTIDGVCEFYGVKIKTMESVIENNKEVLRQLGIRILKGQELKDCKKDNPAISSFVSILTILNRSCVVYIGTLLTASDKAGQMTDFLLKNNPYLLERCRFPNLYIKKYELEFEHCIRKLLGEYHTVKTQVKCGNYRIDFVIDDWLVIEIDENGHEYYDKKQENTRFKYIASEGYDIMRYDTRNQNILEFCGQIVRKLYS